MHSAQDLVPMLYAAGISAIGWCLAFMPEPAPAFYILLRRHQRKHFVELCRLGGRLFGMVFAAWTVVFSVLIMLDLLR